MSTEKVDPLDAYMASLKLPSRYQPLKAAQARIAHNLAHSVFYKECNVVAKNRRYCRLQQLLKDTSGEDHYFSDGMMQLRSPALFHFYLGQYLDRIRDETVSIDNIGQTFSSFLIDTCQRKEMETRRVKEQETWSTILAEDDKENKRRPERLFEEENVEEQEEEDGKEKETTLLTIDERRQQLIEIMGTRFLAGKDSEYVSYAEIDADEALDDLDEMQRDAEDRYFAE